MIVVGDNKTQQNMKLAPPRRLAKLKLVLGLPEDAKPKWYPAYFQEDRFEE